MLWRFMLWRFMLWLIALAAMLAATGRGRTSSGTTALGWLPNLVHAMASSSGQGKHHADDPAVIPNRNQPSGRLPQLRLPVFCLSAMLAEGILSSVPLRCLAVSRARLGCIWRDRWQWVVR